MNYLVQASLLNDAYFDACVAQFSIHKSFSCSSCEAASDFANMLDGCAFQ